jgi:anhydro-N-acetylmuramic acid kinase
MSGTSADGIEAALVEFEGQRFCGVSTAIHHDYPAQLRHQLLRLARDEPAIGLRELGQLDGAVAQAFAAAALDLLRCSGVPAASISAIGSHGQTVQHDPAAPYPTTWQLGDPNRIAAQTGITTVADFRRRDLALCGQGAPLVPAFHHAAFARADEPRCVANIGGIANITVLPDDRAEAVRGFDTGPGNGLMDEWAERHLNTAYDADGAWARSGRTDQALLDDLLADPYFAQRPPKSTGRGYFHLLWALNRHSRIEQMPPADVQASFAELTAYTVAQAVKRHAPGTRRLLVCGGGARNGYLMERLRDLLDSLVVEATTDHGLNVESVEAAAFAWLAMRTLNGLPGNLPAVTGARASTILGGIYRT